MNRRGHHRWVSGSATPLKANDDEGFLSMLSFAVQGAKTPPFILRPSRPITDARLELRLRLKDDINTIYIEEWPGDRWTCRWDRHENDHNTCEHFHPPPVVTTQNAIDVDLPTDPNQTVHCVLQFIDDRISDLWQTEVLTYPDEDVSYREYGPEICERRGRSAPHRER